MKKTILVVAAHPDDEIIGCGGSIARLVKEGNTAYTLILGEGVTSRGKKLDKAGKIDRRNALKKEAVYANKRAGVKKVFFGDFPDNRFDSLPLLELVKVVEEIKSKLNPGIIFTHCRGDLNVDHALTYKAVLTAARPLKKESIREIYSFEVLSSTEWNYPVRFLPNVFFDISGTIDDKLSAAACYKSEMREYPHPRSLKGIRLNAECRGMKCGMEYAEAFELVRRLE